MKSKLHPYIVVDRHTGKTQASYTSERSANYAANKLAVSYKSPNRYQVKYRGY